MKKILTTFIVIVFSFCAVKADEIPNIIDTFSFDNCHIEYPVRDHSLVVVLQPVPDGSGEFIMNICNKKGACRQTSMKFSEMRYVGLFLEDVGGNILVELNQKIDEKKWMERQFEFRKLYAQYMNSYDQKFGILQSINSR